MRYLVTLLLAALTLSAVGQTNPNYNPDYDDDGVIGVSDILGVLSTFGDTWDSGDLMVIEITPITNDNIHEAVDLWLSDECSATLTYGHISDWDVSIVTDMSYLFYYAESFNGNLSAWDVSSVTNMIQMFEGTSSFNGDISLWDVSSVIYMGAMFREAASFNGDISSWDVSSVTDMGAMFEDNDSFNADLSSWDVSSVTNMIYMFREAVIFNSDISAWDVSSVTAMSNMFNGATNFNGDLSFWDVSSVTSMYDMFTEASNFNGDLSSWDVSSVAEMGYMFYNATSFNADLSAWDVTGVTNMVQMFDGASALSEENKCLIHTTFSLTNIWPYDWSEYCPEPLTDANIHEAVDLWLSDEETAEESYGHISNWDVSSVTNMSQLFFLANSFNDDISSWDVSSVSNMYKMFDGATSFNGDLSSWDVSSVTSMVAMFENTDSFNNDISAWDVSSVTDMSYMFKYASSFNRDLSSWDVSSVTNMIQTFRYASSFNGDISSWDVSSVTNMNVMFDGASALSEENQCAIHSSFSSNENWPYDWSGFCPAACGDLVSHEGYDYSTVLIGEQCWFSENCRYLSQVSPPQLGSEDDGAAHAYVYGYYGSDNLEAKQTTQYLEAGALYNQMAVVQWDLCPSGWHVPSSNEVLTTCDQLGGGGICGGALKTTGTLQGGDGVWNEPNVNATNSSGFSAMPCGARGGDGFGGWGNFGYWRTTTPENGYGIPWHFCLASFDEVLTTNCGAANIQGRQGYSARCIQD